MNTLWQWLNEQPVMFILILFWSNHEMMIVTMKLWYYSFSLFLTISPLAIVTTTFCLFAKNEVMMVMIDQRCVVTKQYETKGNHKSIWLPSISLLVIPKAAPKSRWDISDFDFREPSQGNKSLRSTTGPFWKLQWNTQRKGLGWWFSCQKCQCFPILLWFPVGDLFSVDIPSIISTLNGSRPPWYTLRTICEHTHIPTHTYRKNISMLIHLFVQSATMLHVDLWIQGMWRRTLCLCRVWPRAWLQHCSWALCILIGWRNASVRPQHTKSWGKASKPKREHKNKATEGT